MSHSCPAKRGSTESLPSPPTKSPPDATPKSRKRTTNDGDDFLQVRFDPHVQSTHRRKSSLAAATLSRSGVNNSECGSAFLHKILGNWENLDDICEEDEEGDPDEKIAVRHGRLKSMTRNQLHDMVLGLREMGRRYSNVRVSMTVKNIFILTKPSDQGLVVSTRELTEWLLEHGYNVYVEERFKSEEQFDAPSLVDKLESTSESSLGQLRYWNAQMCTNQPDKFDFVLTLGGDGTVLYASCLFQRVVPPILSFSLGSLGFLTKFDFSEHASILKRTLGKDGVTVGLRLRFEGTIMRSIPGSGDTRLRDLGQELLGPELEGSPTHRPSSLGTKVVLNEIVVDRGPNATIAITELYANDEFLTGIAADGVCIATPTGSTAYSLAAGGSLCHPALPGMLVTVICAHSLTFRPLLLPDSMVLRIGVPYDARTSCWVSFDGRDRSELHQGDYVTIVASQYPFPTVQCRKDNKDWFDSIKRTMNWGDRIQQKALS